MTSKFLRAALFANAANTRIVNVNEIRVENEAILRLRLRKTYILTFLEKNKFRLLITGLRAITEKEQDLCHSMLHVSSSTMHGHGK